jgi:4'-phosphopantetheinyl transferase
MKQFENKLDPGTAHLWVVDLTRANELAVDAYRKLLSQEEVDRARRFRFERDRCAFLVSYWILRTALTWCVPGVHPGDWVFVRAPKGRPEIDQPAVVPWLRFNLSHTSGFVACVVMAEVDCGVDVEAMTPLPDLESLCRRVLAPSERTDIAALPDAERACRFFRLWTLKEAYAKARGLGVSLPFERLSFEWRQDGVRLDIDPTLDDGGQWYFEQWQPSPDYMLAVAVRRPQKAFRGIVRHDVPLGSGPNGLPSQA